jgi:hypothetical protein
MYDNDFAYNDLGSSAVLTYQDQGNSNRGTVDTFKITSTQIYLISRYVFTTQTSTRYYSLVYNPSSESMVFFFRDGNKNPKGRSLVFLTEIPTNLTAENYIGISNGAYSNGDAATVQIVGSVDDAQSGLTAGESYYVQSDGTLDTTADTPSVFAGTAVSATKLIVKG